MMSSKCDKCGRIVPPRNNAVNLEIKSELPSEALLKADSRHLMPVVENGKIVCVGSPSRAQYLPGQPRDTRNKFPYNPKRESYMRECYKEMLRKYPIPA